MDRPFPDHLCREMARRHGTPLFVYDTAVARARFRRLRADLPPRVRLAYAVKANPHPGILAALAAEAAAFDCASAGELDRLADLGIDGNRLLYAGPGKRTAELARALRLGARIQADGWEDLARIDQLATGPVSVNLRLHPLAGGREGVAIIGGAGPSAFGVDEEDAPALLARARRLLRQVSVRGFQVFTATNERQADRLLETHRAVFDLAARLAGAAGLDLDQIDLGGGLGVPYADGQRPLDIARLGRGLRSLLNRHTWFHGQVILEPGRYLVAPAGVYLTRVVRVKTSRGVTFAILEGGINHLLRPLLTGEPFPVRCLGRRGPRRRYTLAGPLCTGLDRLGEVDLPLTLTPGDLLAFGQCGAYGATEAMTHFLSHPPPTEWVFDSAVSTDR